MIIGIGGDGTILHCARITAPLGVPVLGVKLGQLGFITEVSELEVEGLLPRVLAGEGWIEQRAMLVTAVAGETLLGLNDAVVRCTSVRLADISFDIDGEEVTSFRGDGVIVATATGSTAYSLAAGGPVLVPEATDLVVQPICSHIGLRHALVLPQDTKVGLKVSGRHSVMLSIDGQIERQLNCGERITITTSNYRARFLRLRRRSYFLSSLYEKLGGKRT